MADIAIVKTFQKPEGERVSIMRRDDGHYRFIAFKLIVENGRESWVPTHWSGIYADMASAERDVGQMFPWAGEAGINPGEP